MFLDRVLAQISWQTHRLQIRTADSETLTIRLRLRPIRSGVWLILLYFDETADAMALGIKGCYVRLYSYGI